jgi:hypothetical protein
MDARLENSHPSRCWGLPCARRRSPAIRKFRPETDSKNGPFGLVQKLHFPLGILFELAANFADQVGANAGQLVPGSVAIGKLDALFGSPGVAPVSDAKEKKRHGVRYLTRKDRSGLGSRKIC